MVELIRSGEIDLVINTPYGQSGPRVDGYEIRTAAVAADIPCITTVAGAAAAIQGIEALTRSDVGVAPLQVLQARLHRDRAAGAPSGMWHRQGEGDLDCGVSGVAYRHLARPVLFRVGKGDAETVHHRTLARAVLDSPGRACAGRAGCGCPGASGDPARCSASTSRPRSAWRPGWTRTVWR